jgi:hypothetical protein
MKEQVLFEGGGILVTSTRVEIDGEVLPFTRITSLSRRVVRVREFRANSPFAVLAFVVLAADLMVLILSCADAISFRTTLWFLGASLVAIPVLLLLAWPAKTYCALRLGRVGKQDRVVRGEDAAAFDAAYKAIHAVMGRRK